MFFRIALASGSSKWWKARLNSRKTFLAPSAPVSAFLYRASRSAGACAASTGSGTNEMLGLAAAARRQSATCGWRSVRTKRTGCFEAAAATAAYEVPVDGAAGLLAPLEMVWLRCFSM